MLDDHYLKLEVIWKDPDMFELRVDCSNGRYSGITEVYDQQDLLLHFAQSLKGYPFGGGEVVHTCGEKDGFSFFQMRFYQIGAAGIVGVQLSLEENTANDYRTEEKHKLTMELVVEPNAIDRFQRELTDLAVKESGVAHLKGIELYTNNIK